MKEICGDILDIKEGWICHQVNLKGVAGGGLAKQIRDKYPKWFEEYCKDCMEDKFILGDCSWYLAEHQTQVIDHQIGFKNKIICNMFAQNNYGTDKRHTNYYAFAQCLSIIKDSLSEDIQIYFPYKIGCGLGGGNWEVISEMIETAIPDAIIVKRKGEK